ncbi:hypothetical protein [Nocardia alni]|uniref:hypothetical protein n=1 Tax=Nocardia alni TaxID=2815723 RepID=UPI001C24D1CB|nr:hypothetical protein [Nocardia alni]
MADQNDMKQQFANLASAAQSGKLLIEDDTAERCAKRCNAYIQELQTQMTTATDLIHQNSFGDLGSAGKYARKIHDLGSGDSPGSYVGAVKQHIAVLQQMADMFKKAGQAFKNSDSETQARIRQTMQSLNGK